MQFEWFGTGLKGTLHFVNFIFPVYFVGNEENWWSLSSSSKDHWCMFVNSMTVSLLSVCRPSVCLSVWLHLCLSVSQSPMFLSCILPWYKIVMHLSPGVCNSKKLKVSFIFFLSFSVSEKDWKRVQQEVMPGKQR